MLTLFAQTKPPSQLLTAFIFAAVSLPIGALLGYLLGFRYKRMYERAARELANLRGENFRGELRTIGIPAGRPAPASRGPAPDGAAPAEIRQLQESIAQRDRQLGALDSERTQLAAELTAAQTQATEIQATLVATQHELAAAQRRADELAQELQRRPTAAAATSTASGTEAWQLAQMHKEQIVMQLRMDEHIERIGELTRALEAAQQQAATWRERAERLEAKVEG